MGCPKRHKNLNFPVHGSSLQAVRCCNPDGRCLSTPCETQLKKYAEAESICHQKGMRLCTANELNQCCGTECEMEYFLTWVAHQLIEGIR